MYKKTTLDNGLRLITSSNLYTRAVSVAVFLAAGPRYENAEEAGISHFVEHLCFKGTDHWPTSRDLSAAIEGIGGVINGGTDKEATVYWCKVPYQHLRLALDVLGDLVRQPRMDQVDMEKERPVIIEELNMCFDSPQHRVDILADEIMWPGQPLGRDIAGSRETVSAIGHESILSYVSQRYLPNNAVLAIAGRFDAAEVAAEVQTRFAGWHPGTRTNGFSSPDGQVKPGLRVEYRKTEQVNLCLGVRGLSAVHADRFRFDLLNAVLGEGMSSRLFEEVREKRGLAYDIHSMVTHYRDTGSLNIYAGVEPSRLKDTVLAILEELDRLKRDMPESEVAKAREMAKGRLLLRMEDSRNVVSWLGSQELITDQVLTPDEVVAQIEQISPEDLKRVASEMLRSDRLNLAVVGPVREKGFPRGILKL